MMEMARKYKEKWYVYFAVGMLVGMISFLVVYTAIPLDVTNDNWIVRGYDETDIIDHYSAWTHFRTSDWSFPLTYMDGLAYPGGTYLSYQDGIPWIAIFFKLFRNVLPETFQFFGIYTFLTYALQGGFAALIIQRKDKNILYVIVGTLFFTFCPILIYRGFRHTALSSHYVFLAGMWVWLWFRDQLKEDRENFWEVWIPFAFLCAWSVGLSPVLMPFVMFFAALTAVDFFQKRWSAKNLAWSAGFMVMNCVSVLISAYVLGALGTGISVERWGYGYFSLNLNALWNPNNAEYTWSKVLPDLPMQEGQYDGFNYLGLGMLVLLAIVVLWCFYKLITKREEAIHFLWNNIAVIILSMIMTVYAASNICYYGDTLIWQFNLPSWINNIFNIYRASGRFLWPIVYLIYVVCIYWCGNVQFEGKRIFSVGVIVLSIACVIQLVDMSTMFQEKHQYLIENSVIEHEPPELFYARTGNTLLIVTEEGGGESKVSGIEAGKMGIKTNQYVEKVPSDNGPSIELIHQVNEELEQGILRPDTIYYTKDYNKYARWQELYADKCAFEDYFRAEQDHYLMWCPPQ